MFDRNFIVLELANILAGPITTMAFAELGARVIKLENPHTGGDATRGWKLASEPADTDISGYFSCANWGKESLACDFTCTAGRDACRNQPASDLRPGHSLWSGRSAAGIRRHPAG